MAFKIDLSGKWNFCLDEEKAGVEKQFYRKQLEDTICLPGTTALCEKGTRSSRRESGYLTEPYHFEGCTWYTRTLEIPKEYVEQQNIMILNLERTRNSYVWIDESFVGNQDSLCGSHRYDLTSYITSTNHRLTIMVDNTNYKIAGGHMTSPDTQTNWNGILGEISLCIYENIYIEDMQLFPDPKKRKLSVETEIYYKGYDRKSEIRVVCHERGQSEEISKELCSGETMISLRHGRNHVYMELSIEEEKQIKLWNEYSPVLYVAEVEVKAGFASDIKSTTIGFRNLLTKERKFYLNDLQIMLRGKHDAMIYPLTGFAPMDKESWIRTFRIAKEYGINHYRFHTCCPPEAAFQAADEEGMYLEPELPFWGTVYGPDDSEYSKEQQEYLEKEGWAILKQFGNHPSFLLFSLGNELWGNQKVINNLLGKYKQRDNRHWYTQGSCNFQFVPVVMDNDDFYCGVRFSKERLFRGSYAMCDAPQGHVQVKEPEMVHNYDTMICPGQITGSQGTLSSQGTSERERSGEIQIQYQTGIKTVKAEQADELIPNIPVVSHEIGQYEFYPDFREIEKYTGVLKPENLIIFKERLEERGLLPYAEKFFEASGKLAVQCYKREMETAFRSRELAGFQLLDLQDFTGQGTALVGVLNAFMENKGIIAADEWRQFCSDRVLMASFPRYVYEAGENFDYEILMTNMNPDSLQNAKLKVSLSSKKTGNERKKETRVTVAGQSRLLVLDKDKIKIPMVQEPEKLELRIELEGTDVQNHYELYVYPPIDPVDKVEDDIIVTADKLEMIRAEKAGKKVLFFGDHIRKEKAVTGTYCTDFWCYPMFASISDSVGKPKPIGTMGMYVNEEHEALKLFESDSYTTPQWWKIITNTQLAVLDDTDITPIVWMIDNFDRNHKIGVLFEARVGNGNVLVCQANLMQGKSLEEKWLYHSLLTYIRSNQFQPQAVLTFKEIEELYES